MTSHDGLLSIAGSERNPLTRGRSPSALPDPDDVRRRLAICGARFLPATADAFPEELRRIPEPPQWLFVRGPDPVAGGVAVVGSRKATQYGLDVGEQIGRTVGAVGWQVVSGLAAGIDGAAHRGCLEGGGTTVAVFGCGIDRVHPRAHRALAERILDAGGTLTSEYGPGAAPEPWRFPLRNRIISGLATVVIVVEAAVRSGALITARLAMEHGREVIVVPGDIDRPTSHGCNLLIRDGAHPLASIDELIPTLELLLGPAPRTPVRPDLPPWIPDTSADIDDVIVASGLARSEAVVAITRLEIQGVVAVTDGRVHRTEGAGASRSAPAP